MLARRQLVDFALRAIGIDERRTLGFTLRDIAQFRARAFLGVPPVDDFQTIFYTPFSERRRPLHFSPTMSIHAMPAPPSSPHTTTILAGSARYWSPAWPRCRQHLLYKLARKPDFPASYAMVPAPAAGFSRRLLAAAAAACQAQPDAASRDWPTSRLRRLS